MQFNNVSINNKTVFTEEVYLLTLEYSNKVEYFLVSSEKDKKYLEIVLGRKPYYTVTWETVKNDFTISLTGKRLFYNAIYENYEYMAVKIDHHGKEIEVQVNWTSLLYLADGNIKKGKTRAKYVREGNMSMFIGEGTSAEAKILANKKTLDCEKTNEFKSGYVYQDSKGTRLLYIDSIFQHVVSNLPEIYYTQLNKQSYIFADLEVPIKVDLFINLNLYDENFGEKSLDEDFIAFMYPGGESKDWEFKIARGKMKEISIIPNKKTNRYNRKKMIEVKNMYENEQVFDARLLKGLIVNDNQFQPSFVTALLGCTVLPNTDYIEQLEKNFIVSKGSLKDSIEIYNADKYAIKSVLKIENRKKV